MPRRIFKEGRRYTFSDYFEMGQPTEEILAELGYSFQTQALRLPKAEHIDQASIQSLRETYYALATKVSLNSEAAKREFMISPVLQTIVRSMDVRLNVEYPVDIDEHLSGTIDYLLRSQYELIVIEAKKGDLEKGFSQLAAEMIAIDRYDSDNNPDLLYGAITIGEVWRFAMLERPQKRLLRDIHTLRFPEDLEELCTILGGILHKG
ncbi:hypothetical protein VSS37_08275 [Candidatus Thiothrix sp. Deng01]|uniref:Type I restriction enzyme R protein N-terminal domain-containing protein n=1 Tax=Candidatus Thiothrix phosphatis TaxID=3112415 RepID=A0ABU6CW16_9GAMM|nr:hypothetical protein [Candidatus Thiothrix sp. Deng01]MEB4590969.1 hypothetical protein [Candidatus Thiothrix sp. Deng01]